MCCCFLFVNYVLLLVSWKFIAAFHYFFRWANSQGAASTPLSIFEGKTLCVTLIRLKNCRHLFPFLVGLRFPSWSNWFSWINGGQIKLNLCVAQPNRTLINFRSLNEVKIPFGRERWGKETWIIYWISFRRRIQAKINER